MEGEMGVGILLLSLLLSPMSTILFLKRGGIFLAWRISEKEYRGKLS
jgi:hypothetical protein